MDELREFECKYCGHRVVVNPELPADYTPNICTPCWETFEQPKQDRFLQHLGEEIAKLQQALKRLNKNA